VVELLRDAEIDVGSERFYRLKNSQDIGFTSMRIVKISLEL
jgi:hypothetical protein